MVIFSQLCKHLYPDYFTAHSCPTYHFLEICQPAHPAQFVSVEKIIEKESSCFVSKKVKPQYAGGEHWSFLEPMCRTNLL